MKHQSLSELFALSFPPTPRAQLDSGHEVYVVEGIDVVMDARGVRDYHNTHSRGEAYRGAILLGINALMLSLEKSQGVQEYTSVAVNDTTAFSICTSPHGDIESFEPTASMRGDHVVFIHTLHGDTARLRPHEPEWSVIDNGIEFIPSPTPQQQA